MKFIDSKLSTWRASRRALCLLESPATGVALESARDRIERHIAEGCRFCSRPRHASPETPGGWDPVAAWEDRWRPACLPVEEASRWTELTGCRPDLAAELRASGLTPEALQRYHRERSGGESGDEIGELPDSIRAWVRSGFSWQEIEALGAEVRCDDELAIERELRLRGVSKDEASREIDVDGEKAFLWDFLYTPKERDGRVLGLAEKLSWLEERGPSVDTSKAAIRRRLKTGHRVGAGTRPFIPSAARRSSSRPSSFASFSVRT